MTSGEEVVKKFNKDLNYKVDLWDKYKILSTKLSESSSLISDMSKVFKTQGDVFEKMGKQMCKSQLNGEAEIGSCNSSFTILLSYTHTLGTKYIFVATELEKKLAKDLKSLKSDIDKKLKKSNSKEKKVRKEFQDANTSCLTAKKKDFDEKNNFETLQISLYQKADIEPKKLKKLQNQVHKAEKTSKKMENEYKKAATKQATIRTKYYKELGLILSDLELLDRTRINTMKSILLKYNQLFELFTDALSTGNDKLSISFNKINIKKDMIDFVKSKKSGKDRPYPEVFEPYKITVQDEITTDKYKINIQERRKVLMKKSGIDYDLLEFGDEENQPDEGVNEEREDDKPVENKIEESSDKKVEEKVQEVKTDAIIENKPEDKVEEVVEEDKTVIEEPKNEKKEIIASVKVLYDYEKKAEEELTLKGRSNYFSIRN